ncbi:IclR family transcriptional regulator [Trebonia kvetii]|uniref:IclR family transcriptional regulator n=1 Tax=Trebonia kvetii TaxID=2480626 RepID=A0A6P2BUX3_9ACTN|nr:IclR family transcriptional regulator [Trebonia kvetii]TVZ02497.1 IclR family transcriptional regulator [Trebonia kvetii]
MAALQYPGGSSAVRRGNVRPIGKANQDMEDDGQASTVVGRLEAILASFDGCDHSLGLSEISHRVGLPKSTVHRLANQLCAVGWLERNSGGYRVGLRLLELGSVALQRTGLREAAFKHLHSLALRTGLVVHLGILDQGEVVYLDRVSTTRVSLPTRVGGRQPAYCTALGKVMLAFEDPARQASALSGMRRRTEFTVIEPRAIQASLDSARQTGIAYDREEAYKGLGCVASPIRSGDRVIGAVSVTGPIARIRAHSLVHEVRNTAAAVWSGDVVPLPRPLAAAR